MESDQSDVSTNESSGNGLRRIVWMVLAAAGFYWLVLSLANVDLMIDRQKQKFANYWSNQDTYQDLVESVQQQYGYQPKPAIQVRREQFAQAIPVANESYGNLAPQRAERNRPVPVQGLTFDRTTVDRAGSSNEHRTRFVPYQFTYSVPVTDPKTGKTTIETKVRQAWRQEAMPGEAINDTRNDQEVSKQVESIKTMDENDADRAAAIGKLRELLDSEFDARHAHQADEIVTAKSRLSKLSSEHKRRGDNKDKIVKRRIDQLLGEPDELAWVPQATSNTPNRIELQPPQQTRNSNHWQFADPGGFGVASPQTAPAAPTAVSPSMPTPQLQFGERAADEYEPSSQPVPAPEFRRFPSERQAGQPTFTPRRASPAAGLSTDANGTVRPPSTESYQGYPSFSASLSPAQRGNTTLSEIFDLVRSAGTANLSIDLARARLAKLQSRNGSQDRHEVEAAKITLVQAEQQSRVFQQQIEAMRKRLSLETDYAKELRHNVNARNSDRLAKLDQDSPKGRQQRFEIQRESVEADKRFADAKANLEQFESMTKDLLKTPSRPLLGEVISGENTEEPTPSRPDDESSFDRNVERADSNRNDESL